MEKIKFNSDIVGCEKCSRKVFTEKYLKHDYKKKFDVEGYVLFFASDESKVCWIPDVVYKMLFIKE